MPKQNAVQLDYDGVMGDTFAFQYKCVKCLYQLRLSKIDFKTEDELKHFLSYKIDWGTGEFKIKLFNKLGIAEKDHNLAKAVIECIYQSKYMNIPMEEWKKHLSSVEVWILNNSILNNSKHDSKEDNKYSLFSGVKSTIKKLKEKGLKVGIVSNNYGWFIETDLRKYGLLEYIDNIIGRERIEKGKPDPESTLLSLKEMGVVGENTTGVGDMETDFIAMEKAGIKNIVGATYGFFHKDRIKEFKEKGRVLHTIDNFEDLLNYV